MLFYVGLHQVNHAARFDRAFISVNRLKTRKSDFVANDWILDSGAFTLINKHGDFPEPPKEYAKSIRRWSLCGNLIAAVSQDYMCVPSVLNITGLTIPEHQEKTIGRYEAILSEGISVYLLPILQGYEVPDYIRHIKMYERKGFLPKGCYVGVGSLCKKNSRPQEIERILSSIKMTRPDLRLHGFGIKITSLRSKLIRSLLYSADSMAWSFAARKQGRNQNSWQEARRFVDMIENQEAQAVQSISGG